MAPIQAYLRHRWRGQPLASDIDDATQEVFVESIKPGGVLEQADPNRGDFRGLLYGVVRNVARRFEERAARAARAGPHESIYLDDLPNQAEALSRVFDRAWAQSLMREALHCHEQQAAAEDATALRRFHVLRMRHEDGMAVRDIAKALKISDVDTVHNDYRQARRVFVRHLRSAVARHTGSQDAALELECRRLIDLLASS